MAYNEPNCWGCGCEIDRQGSYLCWSCTSAQQNLQKAAHVAVSKAVEAGDLPRASGLTCIDCGAPAQVYDHRDYTRPLDVDPVCHPCNIRRGPTNDFQRFKPRPRIEPERDIPAPAPLASPPADEVRAARLRAGHTQTRAGAVVYVALRTWQTWESGSRAMPPGLWELYLIKTEKQP